MRWAWLAIGAVLVLGGCGGRGVRELGERERSAFAALAERLSENEAAMRSFADQLGRLGAEYEQKRFELDLEVAGAKRLDAMRAPWIDPPDDLAQTRRAVVLYHLYEVERAEQRVLDARMRQREAAADQLVDDYRRLGRLTADAAGNLEIVLAHLERPDGARLRDASTAVLGEVWAFRERLEDSPNARLRELAEQVARYESWAVRANERADEAIEAILRDGSQ